jgi:class 3 adenylate cyclase
VGSEGKTNDITVLGDAANTAARLSAASSQGEILISDSAYQKAKFQRSDLEERQLDLKGKTQAVSVRVLTDYRSIA